MRVSVRPRPPHNNMYNINEESIGEGYVKGIRERDGVVAKIFVEMDKVVDYNVFSVELDWESWEGGGKGALPPLIFLIRPLPKRSIFTRFRLIWSKNRLNHKILTYIEKSRNLCEPNNIHILFTPLV